MDQILASEDENGDELQIINASFADPYMLISRENSTVRVFQASGDGELEDVEAAGFATGSWLSGGLFKSAAFEDIFAFLLTPEGGLHVYDMSQPEEPCYVAEGLAHLPPFLTPDYAPRRGSAKSTITELLAADLGDATSKSPHLIVGSLLERIYPAVNNDAGSIVQ